MGSVFAVLNVSVRECCILPLGTGVFSTPMSSTKGLADRSSGPEKGRWGEKRSRLSKSCVSTSGDSAIDSPAVFETNTTNKPCLSGLVASNPIQDHLPMSLAATNQRSPAYSRALLPSVVSLIDVVLTATVIGRRHRKSLLILLRHWPFRGDDSQSGSGCLELRCCHCAFVQRQYQ